MAIGGKRTNRGYWLTANRPQCPFLREMGNVMVYVEIVLQLRTVGGFKFLHHTPPGGGYIPTALLCLPSQNFFCFIFFGVVQFCGVGDVLLPRGAVFGVYEAIWPHFAHRLYILSPVSFSCDMRAFKTSRAVFFDIKKNKILRFSCYLGFS